MAAVVVGVRGQVLLLARDALDQRLGLAGQARIVRAHADLQGKSGGVSHAARGVSFTVTRSHGSLCDEAHDATGFSPWDLRSRAHRSSGMSTVRRSLTGAAAAALALALPAAPAAAAGLPLPVEESPSGVASPGGASRYLTVTLGGRTEVLAQRAATGDVTSRLQLRGRFGIPLVAYDATAGGVSADGRTLVLIRPRAGFPRRTTTFAVLSTHRWLRLRKTLRLAGDFSYDALSPDGRSLFLVNYVSPH